MIARVAVSSKGLVKKYGRRRALDGFTLDVPEGCVMGLVGPNGAGKTTWMMAVAGLVRTDAGTVGLFGTSKPFAVAEHSGKLAILPQDSELPLESTPEGFLCGLARLQGLSADAAKATARKVLEAVNLADRAKASIRSLSHGMRKRLMAAQCFLGEPDLILLDEPMNGLDPEEAVQEPDPLPPRGLHGRRLLAQSRRSRKVLHARHARPRRQGRQDRRAQGPDGGRCFARR